MGLLHWGHLTFMTGTKSESFGTSTCPKCGRQAPTGAKFCGFDGTALGAGPTALPGQQVDRERKICPKCQAEFPIYAVYCPVDASQLTLVRYTQDVQKPAAVTKSRTGQYGTESEDLQYQTDETPMPASELIGQTLGGKYRLEDFLGEGGMAVVYKAMHTSIERPVVIKVMQGRLMGNDKSVKRFELECKLTAKISHPNVVSVFDVGFVNGNQPYLVMEYIPGESLRDRMDRDGPMALATCAQILVQTCRGLQEAHNVGIIHRDLKPENILLQERTDRPDWVKIVDFGIANLVAGSQRLTKTGSVVGTAEYMSPEQLRDVPVDTRADLYALGVILFEMLTARVPFEAESTEAVLLKQLLEAPEPPSKFRSDLSPGAPFDHVVLKAMEKDRDKRYQTATEMRLDLDQIYNQLILRRSL